MYKSLLRKTSIDRSLFQQYCTQSPPASQPILNHEIYKLLTSLLYKDNSNNFKAVTSAIERKMFGKVNQIHILISTVWDAPSLPISVVSFSSDISPSYAKGNNNHSIQIHKYQCLLPTEMVYNSVVSYQAQWKWYTFYWRGENQLEQYNVFMCLFFDLFTSPTPTTSYELYTLSAPLILQV